MHYHDLDSVLSGYLGTPDGKNSVISALSRIADAAERIADAQEALAVSAWPGWMPSRVMAEVNERTPRCDTCGEVLTEIEAMARLDYCKRCQS